MVALSDIKYSYELFVAKPETFPSEAFVVGSSADIVVVYAEFVQASGSGTELNLIIGFVLS